MSGAERSVQQGKIRQVPGKTQPQKRWSVVTAEQDHIVRRRPRQHFSPPPPRPACWARPQLKRPHRRRLRGRGLLTCAPPVSWWLGWLTETS